MAPSLFGPPGGSPHGAATVVPKASTTAGQSPGLSETSAAAPEAVEKAVETTTTVIFDPDGELRLDIGSGKVVSCVVCARTISRASRVFKKMLYGGFRESKPDQGDWAVRLPEDDPQAMTVIFNILHDHFDKFTTALTVAELYRVIVSMDKYDLSASLRPFASTWLQHLVVPDPHPLLDTARVLWISYELGNAVRFQRELRYFLLNSYSVAFERTIMLSKQRFEVMERLGLIEPLQKARVVMITALLDPVKKILGNLMLDSSATDNLPPLAARPQKCVIYKSHLANEASACEALILASLLQGLAAAKLYPLPDPAWYHGNVRRLRSSLLKAVSFIKTLEPRHAPHKAESGRDCWRGSCDKHRSDHSLCSPAAELSAAIKSVYDAPPALLRESHAAHLAAREAKMQWPPRPSNSQS